MAHIRIERYLFEEAAERADVEIREGYNGRFYANDCVGVVGSDGAIREFFLYLAGDQDQSKLYDTSKIVSLSGRAEMDNMAGELIAYWRPEVLELVGD